MRSFWRVLTPRGRLLLGGGITLVTLALLIGERDLVRAGVLAAVLPVLSLLTVLRSPGRVTHTRTLEPRRIAVAEQARIRLGITNVAGRGATGALRLIDHVPAGLEATPVFTIGGLAPGEMREVSYRVAPTRRGRFLLGPVRLAFVDPLGCVTVEHTMGSATHLVVTPRVVVLPSHAPRNDSTQTGTNTAQFAATSGENDTVPREYHHGDDLRRVHWPATASHGTLMVRSEEHRWLERSTLLLDTRAGAHSGTGPHSSFELALSVAGSVALRSVVDGQRLRLVTEAGALDAENGTSAILDTLASLRPTRSVTGRETSLLQRPHSGSVIAVLGALGEAEVQRLVHRPDATSHRRVAVLLQDAGWPNASTLTSARKTLLSAGWHVLVLAQLDQLPEAWSTAVAARSSPLPDPPLR